MYRFYAPALTEADETVGLPDDEAQHLVRVLRVERGAEVLVFNGRGHQCRARVELADRRGVVLRIGAVIPGAPELPFELTLAQALLKGDRMDGLLRDAVMLGVTGVQPLTTRHLAVPAGDRAARGRLERWHRVAVSAAKQCGRAVVPPIAPPRSLETVLAEPDASVRIMLVEPRAGGAVRGAGPPEDMPRPRRATVFVGPEGGWATDEIERAMEAGVRLLTLGDRTLRADAVALVALSVLLYVWGALGK